jgi:hypothetical protein
MMSTGIVAVAVKKVKQYQIGEASYMVEVRRIHGLLDIYLPGNIKCMQFCRGAAEVATWD